MRARRHLCASHKKEELALTSLSKKEKRVEETYSLTAAEYNAILEYQGGVCFICHRKPGRKRLAVDHDHKCCSGKTSCGKCVRGLLHGRCNSFLGWIRDSVEACQRMIEYLTDPPAPKALAHFREGNNS